MRSSPILFYILRCYKRTERQQPLPLPSSKPSERSIKGERLILCKQENIVVGYCWRLVDRSKIEWFWPAVDIYFFFCSLLIANSYIHSPHAFAAAAVAGCSGVLCVRRCEPVACAPGTHHHMGNMIGLHTKCQSVSAAAHTHEQTAKRYECII